MGETDSYMGPYQLLSPLGEGGMGVVYRAVHRESGQVVALKTVKIAKKSTLRSIRREIQALAQLKHPGVIRILEEGLSAAQQLPWYAMELLKGQNLRQWRASLVSPSGVSNTSLDSAGWWTNSLASQTLVSIPQTLLLPSSESSEFSSSGKQESVLDKVIKTSPRLVPIDEEHFSKVLWVISRLCTTLAYLHGEGVLHRDLKPENVLFQQDGRPVLVDFGLASLVKTPQGNSRESFFRAAGERISGTVQYMSPEQIRLETLDARSDLYSLGVLCFELLTGQQPFPVETLSGVLLAHLHTSPPAVSDFLPDIPKDFENLLNGLLQKDREDRPGYAEDIVRVIDRLGIPRDTTSTLPVPRTYLYRPRFSGREKQLGFLQNKLSQLRSNQGAIVWIGGKSGAGKTRLALEVVKKAREYKVKVLLGECEDLQTPLPLSAFSKIFQKLAERCHAKGKRETDRMLGARGKLLAFYYPVLQELPGQTKYSAPVALPFEASTFRLYDALLETLLAHTKKNPLLLLLDDLHWADPMTLGFLRFLLQRNEKKLLVLGTYRSEEMSEELKDLLAHPQGEQLEIGRLEEEGIGKMLEDMLSLSSPPKHFSRFLAKHSEGNPFFVTEYLHTALEEGLLWRDASGEWQVAEPSEAGAEEEDYERLGLPRSLRALISRWLSGLSIPARECLEAAAVLGREFSFILLEQMGFAASDGLSELLARQIFEEPQVGLLRFVHDKLREGALEGISPEKRPLLYERAAKSVESVWGIEGKEGILGLHWMQAGQPEQAKRYYHKGAERAQKNHSHQEAEFLYRTYLSLEHTPSQEHLEALLALGEQVLNWQGKNKEALLVYEEAEQEALSLQNPFLQTKALRLQIDAYRHLARMKEALKVGEKSLVLAKRLENSQEEGIVLAKLAKVHENQDHIQKAKKLYLQALKIHRERKDRREEGILLGNLARILFDKQGETKEAKKLYQESLAALQEVGDIREEGKVLGDLAPFYLQQGLLEKAQSLYERALAIACKVGDRRTEGRMLGNIGLLFYNRGDLVKAQEFYQKAVALLQQVGDRRLEGVFLGNLVGVFIKQNQFKKAKEVSEKALLIHRQVRDREAEAITLANLGDLQEKQGQFVQAKEFYQDTIKRFLDLENPWITGVLLGQLAHLQRRLGDDLNTCKQHLQQGQDILKKVNNQFYLLLLICYQGHISLAQQKSAETFLGKARKIAQKLKISEEGEVGQALQALENAQKVFLSGDRERLFRGELIEDCPEVLRNWWYQRGVLEDKKIKT